MIYLTFNFTELDIITILYRDLNDNVNGTAHLNLFRRKFQARKYNPSGLHGQANPVNNAGVPLFIYVLILMSGIITIRFEGKMGSIGREKSSLYG